MIVSQQRPWSCIAALVAIVLAVALGGSVSAPAFAQPSGDGAVRDGLSEPVKTWIRSVESGDIAAITRMNPETTVTYPPDAMTTRGTRDIVAGYTGMFRDFKVSVLIEDAHYIQQGDIVSSWGLFTLTLTPKAGGEPTFVKGRFTDIARQANGQWEYIVDHASVPLK
jgi:ketosteroid isomerase-like protein